MSFDQIDYRHYLDQNKLKESDRFQPVFEAVENAFNAIEERLRLEPGSPDGLVTITINRRAEQRTIGDQKSRGQFSPPEIAGFTVVDNGVGFRDENWAAFKTVYTSHKKLHGGKGVGRLSYLQAFTEAEVTSTYPCADGCRRRRFTIQRTASGVSDDQVEELEAAACETTLVLRNFEPRYSKKAPKALDAIARSFVVHFFQRFSVSAGSQCLIVDDWDDTKLNLNQFCHSEFMLKKLDEPISIGSYPLMITHTKCKTRVADKHQIMLCANGRVVRTVDLPKDALPTKKKLDSGDGGYFYVAFVNGSVLDEHANQDRLGFALEEATGETVFEDDLPSIQQIAEAVGAAGRKFLAADIDPLEEEHRQRVIKYCTDNIAYRPLIKNRMEQLMTISFGSLSESLRKKFGHLSPMERRSSAAVWRNGENSPREHG